MQRRLLQNCLFETKAPEPRDLRVFSVVVEARLLKPPDGGFFLFWVCVAWISNHFLT
jgi:hypothetical protein